LEGVGLDDDFFVLGGHSMLAFRVRKRLERDLDLRVPLETVLGARTLEELAAAIEQLLEVRPGSGSALGVPGVLR
jgi:acyl carrier protein